MSENREEVPEDYLCPITNEVMTNPVVAADGNTYQKGNIAEWVMRGKRNSPLTGELLSDTKFYDNLLVKKMVRKFFERRFKSKESLKPDPNLYFDEKQQLVKDLLKQLEDMKTHLIEVLKGKENSDLDLKGENSKLNEEDRKLKSLIKKNRLSLLLKTESGIKQPKSNSIEINIYPDVKNLNTAEVKIPDQINIQTKKIPLGTELNRPFKSIHTLEGHSNSVYCLTKLSDNEIASGSYDTTIRVWKRDKGNFTLIDTLEGHSNWVTCLTKLSDNEIASGSSDNTIRVWSNSL
jgi:WD40 repeat protein